jgi:hypothetical protein
LLDEVEVGFAQAWASSPSECEPRKMTKANKAKANKSNKSVTVMEVPELADKIVKRTYYRSGPVAKGTLLSSGARLDTVTLKRPRLRRP